MSPLKILAIADLHDQAERLLPLKEIDADLICFCGDLHNSSGPKQAEPVAEALAEIGPPVLIVPGNTDHRDVVPDIWQSAGLKMIHNGSHIQGDYSFIGMGGMVVRNPSRLGDPARYYHLDEDVYKTLAKSFSQISASKRKIVMTHQPPLGARDVIYNGENKGCLSLRQFIEEFQPDLLLCGHIHEDRGETRIGKTLVINTGELRRGYAAVLELDDDKEEAIKVKWIEP